VKNRPERKGGPRATKGKDVSKNTPTLLKEKVKNNYVGEGKTGIHRRSSVGGKRTGVLTKGHFVNGRDQKAAGEGDAKFRDKILGKGEMFKGKGKDWTRTEQKATELSDERKKRTAIQTRNTARGDLGWHLLTREG